MRRNNFEMTIAPALENRTEVGAYGQDEIIFDRVRLTIGGTRRQVRQPGRSGVLAAPCGRPQGERESFGARRVQQGVPLAVGDQQLSGHADRRPNRFERAGPAPAAAAAASRGDAVSARRARRGQQAADWVDAAGRADRGIADGLRGGVYRNICRSHDRGPGGLRQRPRQQHQLHAAPLEPRPVHRGQPAAGLAAAAGAHRPHGRAGDLSAADRIHVSESRPDPPEGRRAVSRSSRQPRALGICQLLVAGGSDHSRRPESVSASGALASADASSQRRLQFRPAPATLAASR